MTPIPTELRELLPCPFCGGDQNADASEQHAPDCYFILLASFKVAAAKNADLSLAPAVTKAWNRRATPPADAADMGGQAGEEALQEWARDRFSFAGRYKGQIYGNTDWATARAMHADLLVFYAQRDAQHRQQAGKLGEALRASLGLWPADMSDDGSGRLGFKPETILTVQTAREALADWDKTNG